MRSHSNKPASDREDPAQSPLSPVTCPPTKRSALRRIRIVALCTMTLLAVWLLVLGVMIWRFGAVDQAVQADCIIVLGASVQGGNPSPVFEERIRHGVQLYQRGFASKILFTGGFGEGQSQSEGRVGASFATTLGVPRTAVLFEEISRTTRQNLSEALAVMHRNGLKSAVIVSDPLHMRRAMWMAHDLEIKASSSPTPSSRYRSTTTRASFLARELYFFHHYFFTGN